MGFTTYDAWKTTPPDDDCWLELRCQWCTGNTCDGEEPCSEPCERIAVAVARTRRVTRLMLAVESAQRTRDEYVAELAAIEAQSPIRDERIIAERVAAHRRVTHIDATIRELDEQISTALRAES